MSFVLRVRYPSGMKRVQTLTSSSPLSAFVSLVQEQLLQGSDDAAPFGVKLTLMKQGSSLGVESRVVICHVDAASKPLEGTAFVPSATLASLGVSHGDIVECEKVEAPSSPPPSPPPSAQQPLVAKASPPLKPLAEQQHPRPSSLHSRSPSPPPSSAAVDPFSHYTSDEALAQALYESELASDVSGVGGGGSRSSSPPHSGSSSPPYDGADDYDERAAGVRRPDRPKTERLLDPSPDYSHSSLSSFLGRLGVGGGGHVDMSAFEDDVDVSGLFPPSQHDGALQSLLASLEQRSLAKASIASDAARKNAQQAKKIGLTGGAAPGATGGARAAAGGGSRAASSLNAASSSSAPRSGAAASARAATGWRGRNEEDDSALKGGGGGSSSAPMSDEDIEAILKALDGQDRDMVDVESYEEVRGGRSTPPSRASEREEDKTMAERSKDDEALEAAINQAYENEDFEEFDRLSTFRSAQRYTPPPPVAPSYRPVPDRPSSLSRNDSGEDDPDLQAALRASRAVSGASAAASQRPPKVTSSSRGVLAREEFGAEDPNVQAALRASRGKTNEQARLREEEEDRMMALALSLSLADAEDDK